MTRKRQRVRRSAAERTTFAVVHLGKAKSDARTFLNAGQCLEVEDVAARLENVSSPEEIWDLKIEKLGEVERFVQSGASLGRIEAEVWFARLQGRREVVILGVFARERGEAASWVRIVKMENRLHHYLAIVK
jgi:hypothetical protein